MRENDGSITKLLTAGLFVVVTLGLTRAVYTSLPRASEPLSTAPAAPPEATAAPMDLTTLWVVLGSVGGVTLLAAGAGAAWWFVSRARRARAERLELVAAGEKRALTITARRAELDGLYADFLLDVTEVLKRPLLSDVTVPQTAAFIEAHAVMAAMDTALDLADLDTAEQVVTRAWTSWRTADAHARKVGLGSMTREERKRVTQAQRLLAIAGDDAASEFERATALNQARKLLDGLVVLPARTMVAVEASTRRAIAHA